MFLALTISPLSLIRNEINIIVVVVVAGVIV